jgi:CelD/BcsL family acetyltransferase involved in cellulose biosynthesis
VNIYITDPILDNRWDELLARHPRASVFHRRGWLEALARTYQYQPLVVTSAPAGAPLGDGIVFCRVSSWLTGTRLVSLPFADHCEPLLNESGECLEFIRWLRTECDRHRSKYVELRPLSTLEDPGHGLQPSRAYCFHELDLTPSLEQIFRRLHKDSIQRKIRQAKGKRIEYEVGRSKELLDQFYRLMLMTRRRHRWLPQPKTWFKNLVDCMGGELQIRVARKDGNPIAAMLTLRCGATAVYKYGCSDERFHNLGAMPFLFWKFIEESKNSGGHRIDFGRSDLDNDGLITFKEKFGATRKLLTYYRYPESERGEILAGWRSHTVRQFFSVLPDAVSSTVGALLYRHIA